MNLDFARDVLHMMAGSAPELKRDFAKARYHCIAA
jgi:hypothetical protein